MIRFLQTPGRLQKTLLVGFLAIVCIMMVVTLVPGGILGDTFGVSENSVAKVGSHDITVQDVQQQTDSMLRQQFPRGAPPQLRPFFVQRAVQSLILQNVMLTEAERLGLSATKEELRYQLLHGPYAARLFPDGNFIGEQAYESLISDNLHMSVAQFEAGVRKDLAVQKLRAAIEGGVTVSNAEIMAEYNRENTQVKFDYATISVDSLAKQINPTDTELKAYYETNKQQFVNSIPEQRKARYLLVDETKLPNMPQVTADDLKAYYQSHQDEYRVPESVTVRHILITAPAPGPNVDQKAVDAARAKAEDVLKQLKAGGNFAALAKKYSDDPGSKDKGGELGEITRGRTVPEFEQAAFSAKPGELVGPVRTQFGFHIIQVEKHTMAHLKSLDEVKPQIEPIILRQKELAAASTLAQAAQTAARTDGMQKTAASMKLQMVDTDFFGRGDALPGIGTSQQFSDFVFNNDPKARPTSVSVPNGFAIVQVTDVKPAATPTFDQIKAKLTQMYKQDRAQSLLAQKTQELSDKARSGHNLKAAAKEMGADFKTSDMVKPGDQVPGIGQLSGQLSSIFDMKPGEISGPMQADASGVVVALVDKQQPSEADFAKSKDQIRQALLGQKQDDVVNVYVSALQARMQKSGKIRINNAKLAQLTQTTDNQ